MKQIAAMGLVTLKQATINDRHATLVISNGVYYQRLLRLDDMYAAHLGPGGDEFGLRPYINRKS